MNRAGIEGKMRRPASLSTICGQYQKQDKTPGWTRGHLLRDTPLLFEQWVQMLVTPLLFLCAKTVSELHLFVPLRLLLERKPIPQIVVNVRTSRKTTEPLEATSVPWAQGVGRSNRPAPTKSNQDIGFSCGAKTRLRLT
jgi:hypothetical protein